MRDDSNIDLCCVRRELEKYIGHQRTEELWPKVKNGALKHLECVEWALIGFDNCDNGEYHGYFVPSIGIPFKYALKLLHHSELIILIRILNRTNKLSIKVISANAARERVIADINTPLEIDKRNVELSANGYLRNTPITTETTLEISRRNWPQWISYLNDHHHYQLAEMLQSASSMLKEETKMTIINNVTIPDSHFYIYLEVSLWSGKRALREEHIGLDKTIERDLAKLGTLNMFDTELAKVFRNLKNEAIRSMLAYGVPFNGGYLQPKAKHDWLIDKLEEIKRQFYDNKMVMMHRYDVDLHAWAKKAEEHQPGLGDHILKNAYSKEYVDNQIQFNFGDMDDAVSQIGNTLLQGVAQESESRLLDLQKTMRERNNNYIVTRKTTNTLEPLRKKLLANTLLDPRVKPIVALIDDFLRTLPPTNKRLSHKNHTDYLQLLSTLSNVELLYAMLPDDPAEMQVGDGTSVAPQPASTPVEQLQADPLEEAGTLTYEDESEIDDSPFSPVIQSSDDVIDYNSIF